MYNSGKKYLKRNAVVDQLCQLRGTSKLNELEKQASDAVRTVCGRYGLETAEDLSRVLRYVARNGYPAEDKPLIQGIVNKHFYRRI